MKGSLLAALMLLTLIAGSAYSGWWAREFVYTLERIPVRLCELDGGCGDR